ncbi:unnamed protein product [Trypanosoma congolense IL3000]|uniref:WGS project CAEQ00000000 data, annotated contig 1046 n=1 Tax=Trypanosoma congolense (strain IL3000) TaxID=1068625 RepID=F9W3F1_TRYCI|nr:unnamed protein product [Trypanosoma congolense IL3000]
MVIKKIFPLLALVLCVGLCSSQPSTAEFHLFCRILAEANDMILEQDYVYDENKDRQVLKEIDVLHQATTENMEDFRKMLWETKEFLEKHPPPMQLKNRQEAHREIGMLIADGERKIHESRGLSEKANEEMKKAKLSAVQGLYGDEVKEVPRGEANWTAVRTDTKSIFVDVSSAKKSCGNESNATGKTLINDFFCVCVGEGFDEKVNAPCHDDIMPPKAVKCPNNDCCEKDCCKDGCCTSSCENNCCNCGCWTQMGHKGDERKVLNFSESIKKIEDICKDTLEENLRKNMLSLLVEYQDMIGKGTNDSTTKKIFGHSGRKKKEEVTTCDGTQGSNSDSHKEKYNEKICVNYKNNYNKGNKTYSISWHNKFKNYFMIMKKAKNIKEKILKNRAQLLLLKDKAWTAYTREKDDESANLDDMNMSHIFDGWKLNSVFPFPYLFLILAL